MIQYFIKASSDQLFAGMLDTANWDTETPIPAAGHYREVSHQLIHAYYPEGLASIYGPSTIGNPAEPFWFILCDDSVVTMLEGRGLTVPKAKTEMRSNGLLRAWAAADGASIGRIRNSGGNAVGLMIPTIAGRSPIVDWLGNEDPEQAAEVAI